MQFQIFLGIIRISWPKMAQKGGIFRNFQTYYLGSTICVYGNCMYQKSTEFFWIRTLSGFPGISSISWPKMAQKGAFFEIFKPIIWAQLCAYGNCPCTKSVLNFFWIRSSSGFPGISRVSWPKMAQKGAFFEIFKPIIWAQLCFYGNCPCTKSLMNFF